MFSVGRIGYCNQNLTPQKKNVDGNIMRIFVSRKEIDRSFHFAYSLEIGNRDSNNNGNYIS